MLLIRLAVWMLLLSSPALAHSWYDTECCGGQDCHPVPCDEIVETAAGWRWRGIDFDKAAMRASHDKDCHVCVSVYRGLDGKASYVPHCLYGQMSF